MDMQGVSGKYTDVLVYKHIKTMRRLRLGCSSVKEHLSSMQRVCDPPRIVKIQHLEKKVEAGHLTAGSNSKPAHRGSVRGQRSTEMFFKTNKQSGLTGAANFE